MNFETLRKIEKMKEKLIHGWYKLVLPLAKLENSIYDYRSKQKAKKKHEYISNLTIEKVSKMIAKKIKVKMAKNPKLKYRLFVCDSNKYNYYCSSLDPYTPLEQLIAKYIYINDNVRDWASESQPQDGVLFAEAMCQTILDELANEKGIDVHWEYECEENNRYKYTKPVRNYQKHLVIQTKE